MAFTLLWATVAHAQATSIAPGQNIREQDQTDLLQGRSSVVLGSGARALGMGGAFLARADDATAASWNPAGLSYLRHPEISLVGARTWVDTISKDASGPLPVNDSFLGYSPDFVAAAWPVHLKQVTGAVQLGFQRVVSFTGDRTIERPEISKRYQTRGGFDVLALGSGLRVTSKLRLGATYNRWFNGYHQTFDRIRTQVTSNQETDFSISGWNANLGAIFSPLDSLNLGAVLKTGFTADVRLKRSRSDIMLDVRDGTQTTTSNAYQSDAVRLDFPGAVGFGFSWRPRSALTLSGDYTRTFWSQARIRHYFTLPATVAGEPRPVPAAPDDVFAVLLYPTINDAAQSDTEQVRMGLEYVIFGSRVKWPVRAGYFNDRQYFRAGTGEAPRFNGFTLGGGLLIGPVLLDVAYVFEAGSYVDQDVPGSSKSVRLHRVLGSLIYRYGSTH